MNKKEHWTKEEVILYKKSITIWKIFLYYFFIQFLLWILGMLIFFTATVSPFTDDFKNNWNNNYVANNVTYIKWEVDKYNIQYSKVWKCEIWWFYEKNSLLYFCADNTIYIFTYNKNITELLSSKQSTMISYGIGTAILSILTLILLWLTNRIIFTKGSGIASLNQWAKELSSILDEIEEYIDNAGTRLDYRLPTLESLAMSVIDEEIDFFNRFASRIKDLSEKAKQKHMTSTYIKLYILYKELQKKYYKKKWMYFNALASEISLIVSKYNTSILWFFITVLSLVLMSTYILMTLFQMNWNDLTLLDSFKAVINIMTLREDWLILSNIFQEWYIIYLQLLSYVILLASIKLITTRK